MIFHMELKLPGQHAHVLEAVYSICELIFWKVLYSLTRKDFSFSLGDFYLKASFQSSTKLNVLVAEVESSSGKQSELVVDSYN